MNDRLRVSLAVWLIGMPGVVAASVYVVPALLAGHTLPMSMGALQAISTAQSAVLLLVAAGIGGFLSPRVGLHAWFVEAALTRQAKPSPRPIVLAGLLGGLAGALLLTLLAHVAPAALMAAQVRFDLPLLPRVLYGGLTEEVLIRWGLMTLLAYVGAKISQRGGLPTATVMWGAIVVSAFAFGAAHLPAAKILAGPLTGPVVVYVLAGNAAFGLLAGWLYWRRGLEAAMLAHVVAHAGAYAVATAGA